MTVPRHRTGSSDSHPPELLLHLSDLVRECLLDFAADGQVMAAEWSKYDIQCNTIGPTIVLTDMGAKAWG